MSDLAAFFDVSPRRLYYHLYAPNRPAYYVFTLKKASGGFRTIASPPPTLSIFQKRLLQCLTAIVKPKDPVHGFVENRSVATNAAAHVGRGPVLNIDIEDFFGSIHFGRIRGVFENRPFDFPTVVSTMLAQICCRTGTLPQGAPTSPILSNLICRGLDRDLERYARKYRCRYTRYADDITLSSDSGAFDVSIVAALPTLAVKRPTLGHDLKEIFRKHDLTINSDKVRLRPRHDRQEVTGLIVNTKLNVPRKYIRNIRALIYDCEKNGIATANGRFQGGLDGKQRRGGRPDVLDHLRGKLDYLSMVRGADDPTFGRLAIRAQTLSATYKTGVHIWGHSARDIGLLETVLWIVLGFDGNNVDVAQASAFSLAGVGLVSARHAFATPSQTGFQVVRWEVFRACAPQRRFAVTGIHDHPDLDLTIIECGADTVASLRPRHPEMRGGAKLSVVGFPQWNNLGDKLFRADGYASQIKVAGGIRYITTTVPIRNGLSGGPILDAEGHVAAVALYDGSGSIAPDGGIDIKHIDTVKAAPLRPV